MDQHRLVREPTRTVKTLLVSGSAPVALCLIAGSVAFALDLGWWETMALGSATFLVAALTTGLLRRHRRPSSQDRDDPWPPGN